MTQREKIIIVAESIMTDRDQLDEIVDDITLHWTDERIEEAIYKLDHIQNEVIL